MPPKLAHQMTIDFFHNRPLAAVELLRAVAGVDLPPFSTATVEAVDATQLTPVEYRADVVVVLRDEPGTARLALIVEVQMRRDVRKRYSWPVYAAALRARLLCDTALLVICLDRAVGRWCERAIPLGPSGVITPVAVYSDRMPLVIDPDEARSRPELAVLSAAMNGDRPEIDKALEVMLEGLNEVDEERVKLYLDYVFAQLPNVMRKRLKELLMSESPTYEKVAARYFTEWVDKGRAEGLAKGRAEGLAKGHAEGEIEAILRVLESRGLDIPSESRERIRRCSDLHVLNSWLDRVASVRSVDDLFD